MMRVVEEIAFDAPDLVVHLFPFGARFDPDFHASSFSAPSPGLAACAVDAMNQSSPCWYRNFSPLKETEAF